MMQPARCEEGPPSERLSGRGPIGRCLAVVGILTMTVNLASAQVTYFERPPTLEELRAALGAGTAPSEASLGSGQTAGDHNDQARYDRSRGIVWKPLEGALPSPGPGLAPSVAFPINFGLGSSRIQPLSLPYIDSIAALLRSDPSLKLSLEGHTDSFGSDNLNVVLSWDRAYGVFRTLIDHHGVDPARLSFIGKGPFEPLAGLEGSDARNRRVQIKVK